MRHFIEERGIHDEAVRIHDEAAHNLQEVNARLNHL
jgi:hypothetical protein